MLNSEYVKIHNNTLVLAINHILNECRVGVCCIVVNMVTVTDLDHGFLVLTIRL